MHDIAWHSRLEETLTKVRTVPGASPPRAPSCPGSFSYTLPLQREDDGTEEFNQTVAALNTKFKCVRRRGAAKRGARRREQLDGGRRQRAERRRHARPNLVRRR